MVKLTSYKGISVGRLIKTTKILRITEVSVETRTEHLTSTNLEHSPHSLSGVMTCEA